MIPSNWHLLSEAPELQAQVQNFLRAWQQDLPFIFQSSGSTGEPKSFQFTKDQLNGATVIQLAIYKWDKFGGRVLGDIIIDGKSLRYMLIENGFAREYYGDKKKSWCE